MDPRRFLRSALPLAGAGLLLSGCAALQAGDEVLAIAPAAEAEADDSPAVEVLALPAESETAVPYLAVVSGRPTVEVEATSGPTGRAAIARANQAARAPSRADGFVGGVQVFAWSPGRVFEIWTAPLRVTTLTLGEGETLVSKAAGDTVRWQIGEVASGAGSARRTHVLIKPL
ncbi:TrbG/VirB9 family P-type conjugative transfer protein, partial [Brevundimonas bullata]|uniref:TrbG/VirB9 family P-type conjugative transfer protein n=1 Tax=Brevundimonas bullata TaxID=13160 RepID=UPI002FDB6236